MCGIGFVFGVLVRILFLVCVVMCYSSTSCKSTEDYSRSQQDNEQVLLVFLGNEEV